MLKYYRRLLGLFAMVATLAVPYSYIYLQRHVQWLHAHLPLRIDPIYSGGEVWATYTDPLGDDNGAGALQYPSHEIYRGGGWLDIVRYTVYEPVIRGGEAYWQVALTLAALANPLHAVNGFTHAVIHIYIDLDGPAGGRLDTAFARAENVAFCRQHPWDFLIHADGFVRDGFIMSADGQWRATVRVITVPETHTIYLRMPLTHPGLRRVLSGQPTFHYVMTGAYDALSSGNFMPLQEKPGLRSGGGLTSPLMPKIFDYLAPANASQHALLSAFDEKTFGYAQLIPVEIDPAAHAKKIDLSGLLAQYKQKLAAETVAASQPSQSKRPVSAARGVALAQEYMANGMLAQAEAEVAKLPQPLPPAALAVSGALLALKAGQSQSQAMALTLVQQAFALLDRAVASAQNPEDMLSARLYRAHVAVAVPDFVFHKMRTGINDFVAAAQLLEQAGKPAAEWQDCVRQAALAYEKLEKPEAAELLWLKLGNCPTLDTCCIVDLLERGIKPLCCGSQ